MGFPIWYGVYPSIVQTFLDSLKLEGKTVVFFSTSGGSKAGKAIEYAKSLTKNADKVCWLDDKLINGLTQEEVNAWAAAL